MPTKRAHECMDLKLGKASKPLIEKRRRARINQSLAQLKTLVIDPKTTENSRQAKLEKADILEMTVKHLRDIKNGQNEETVMNADNPQERFESGFSECVRQVEHFLASAMDPQLSGIDENLRKRLKDHLWKSLQCLQSPDYENNISSKDKSDRQSPPPTKKRANDFSLSNQNDQNSVLYTDDSHASNSMDLSYHSPNGSINGVYNYNPINSIENFHSSNEKRNRYNSQSLRDSTSSGISQSSCSPLTDSSVEGSPFNLSLDKPDADRDPGFFYTNHVQKLSNHKSETSLTFHPQQTSPKTLSSNLRVEETFERPSNSNTEGTAFRQIPLLPRRLQNGEWALVIPGSLSLSENEVHDPFSAFKFVLPSRSIEVDQERRQQIASSPLSSTVSDMSAEEYIFRNDGDAPVKLEYDGQIDTFQYMWRPW